MPECPVCGRGFDGQLSVFAPPFPDAFDTVECARRAARDGAQTPPALVLPTIDVLTSLGAAASAKPVARRGAAWRLAPVPLAVAAGLFLVAAGTASSVALWSILPSTPNHASRTAAPAIASGKRAATPPAATAESEPGTAPANSSTPASPAPPETTRAFRGVIRLVPPAPAPAPSARPEPTSSPIAWRPEPEPEPSPTHSTGPTSRPKPTAHPAPTHSPPRASSPQPAPPVPQPSPAAPAASDGGQSPANHGAAVPAHPPPPDAAGHDDEGDGSDGDDGDDGDSGKKPKKAKTSKQDG